MKDDKELFEKEINEIIEEVSNLADTKFGKIKEGRNDAESALRERFIRKELRTKFIEMDEKYSFGIPADIMAKFGL